LEDAKLKELGDNPRRTQLGRLGEKPERKYFSGSTQRGWSEEGLRCYVALLEKVKIDRACEAGWHLKRSIRRE